MRTVHRPLASANPASVPLTGGPWQAFNQMLLQYRVVCSNVHGQQSLDHNNPTGMIMYHAGDIKSRLGSCDTWFVPQALRLSH